MPQNELEGQQPSAETLLDGVFHELSFREKDPQNPEKEIIVKERIRIRKVAFTKMDTLGKAWSNYPAEVAVYIDRPLARVEQLTDDSFEVAFGEGRRINFPSFKKWFGWQAQTLDALGQGGAVNRAVELADQIVGEEVRKKVSSTLSPS